MTTNSLISVVPILSLVPDEFFLEQAELESPALPLGTSAHDLYCKRSGLLLGQFIPSIRDGGDILFREFHSSVTLHPVYGYDAPKLCARLHSALHSAAELEWDLSDSHKIRIRLLCSAILWKLDCVKQERACLPAWHIAAGSAARILSLAKWYWNISSRRLAFPIYSIASRHNNLQWNNFRWWLDGCFEIKSDWETKSRKAAQRQELLDASETTQLILRKKLYKRIDLKKVWGWIDLQLDEEFSAKQKTYWKELFLDGDLEPHMWVEEDVNDLQSAIVDCCDIGNEISYFISDRLTGIKACIRDYRSGFTLIGAKEGSSDQAAQTVQEADMLSALDAQLGDAETLPPAPEQKDYPTLGSFLKAQAQWNLLSKRLKARKAS